MKFENLIGKGFDRWSQGSYSPGQIQAFYDFHNSFILLSGAYRSGKSEIGARIAIRHCTLFPNAKYGVFRQHQASLRKSTLRTVLELIHPSWVQSWSNTYLELVLLNGSTMSFIGCDAPDRLGSIELTGAFIDEASEVSEESLGMIQGRLSGALKLPPNYEELPEDSKLFLQNTKSIRQVYLACNPKSKNHYLYPRFIQSPKPGHISYNSNSVSNNNLPEVYLLNNLSAYAKPGVTQEWILQEIRAVRAGEKPADGLHLKPYLTEFGQRNLLGLWVAMEGAIYTITENDHLVDEVPDQWGAPTGKYIVGVDFGYHNPRALLLEEYRPKYADSDGFIQRQRSHYAVVKYWGQEKSSGDDLVKLLDRWDETYNLHRVYAPHDQPGIKKVARKALGASKIRSAKVEVFSGISLTRRFLDKHRVVFVRQSDNSHETTWNEMTGYSWKMDSDGNYLDEPLKEKDHSPDALRYALFSAHEREELDLRKSEQEVMATEEALYYMQQAARL